MQKDNKGLAIYDPAVGHGRTHNHMTKILNPPSKSYRKFFDPPRMKNERILAPLNWQIG